MRTAPPQALTVDVRPAMTLRLSESELRTLFPVEFQDVDPLAAAEPSRATLIRLDSGKLAVVEFGIATSTLTVSVPVGANVDETLSDLFLEAPINGAAIAWIADDATAFHAKR